MFFKYSWVPPMKIFPTKIESVSESSKIDKNMIRNEERNNGTAISNRNIENNKIRNFHIIHDQLRERLCNDELCINDTNDEIISSARSVSDVSDNDHTMDLNPMNYTLGNLDLCDQSDKNHGTHNQSNSVPKGEDMIIESNSNQNENEYPSSPSKPQGSKRIRYLKEWVAVINKFAADEVRTYNHNSLSFFSVLRIFSHF